MILTLYKNCILNEKYVDVYDTRINDNTSPLNEYLNSLENITIEIDNVYIKDSGTIILPYETNINNVLFNAFDYNYMKMESDDGEITRYAFINRGELGNNVAIVEYTQDIWSNWSNKCKVERGIISKISEPNAVYQASNSIDIVSYGTVKVTEDLIEASKASSGNIKLNIEEIKIKELINQTIGEFKDKFEEKGLLIETKMPGRELKINADSRYIYRIIENLFSNITKYAQENTRVYIDITEENSRIRISIKNISKESLNISADELMQRFVRGDKSRYTEGSGLRIVYS